MTYFDPQYNPVQRYIVAFICKNNRIAFASVLAKQVRECRKRVKKVLPQGIYIRTVIVFSWKGVSFDNNTYKYAWRWFAYQNGWTIICQDSKLFDISSCFDHIKYYTNYFTWGFKKKYTQEKA